MSHYAMVSIYCNCTRLIKNKLKIKAVVFTSKVGKNPRYFVGILNKTIIPIHWCFMDMR